MEKKYSLIITPSEEISCQIKEKTKKISGNTGPTPHMSLCKSFSSSNTDFIDRAKNWLNRQNPFLFTLRKVDSFSQSSTVFLTSDDSEEIAEISELSFGLESALSSYIRIDEKNINEFFPHLTLDFVRPPRKIKKVKSEFRHVFEEPILFPITKVDINEKIGFFRWKTIDTLQIGGCRVDNQHTLNEYQFGANGRASIA